jgi:hypothetical protein
MRVRACISLARLHRDGGRDEPPASSVSLGTGARGPRSPVAACRASAPPSSNDVQNALTSPSSLHSPVARSRVQWSGVLISWLSPAYKSPSFHSFQTSLRRNRIGTAIHVGLNHKRAGKTRAIVSQIGDAQVLGVR